MSEYESLESRRRDLSLRKSLDGLLGEMGYAMIIAVVIAVFVMANKSKECEFSARTWLTVVIGTYLLDFILAMFQYHKVKSTRKESVVLMAFRFLVLSFLVGWLVYGNALYYKEAKNPHCSDGLKLIMFLTLLFGYFEMIKCCCMSLIVCIMIPLFFFAVRRQQRPNWIPAPPKFIQDLYKTKFDPSHNQAFQNCAICLQDFQENDEIIPLPCDDKHYFHTKCIMEWLG